MIDLRTLALAGTLFVFACGGSTTSPAESASPGEGAGEDELPEHAHPTGGVVDPSTIEGKDLIGYRELTPDDFRAEHPPEEMRQYAERLGALTCANVFTDPEPRYFIEKKGNTYEGGYMNLAFVARMDRGCSWWNPNRTRVPEEYVLQHEQIHFGLAESAARRLNVRAAKVLEHRARGSSQEAVDVELQTIVEDMMKEAIDALLARNLEFDRDTSNTYAPKEQQRWYDEVMGELSSVK